ncbi:hypothetical protein K435DRAFT_846221 [Dendrothele bispora CBS 962.96]|uniref:Uncharacterized protein n=1 Tax=Dendrothele bispora (strain CBS 962.96) TaxID=1314807 RepID=A0A4S8KNW6_DENBC|nr:hypothetical protein K435DRAFT_846221 [Dendrothele bispora CBS 962.96]
MAYTATNNSRLDDDARHLTQDYPAFGENLSRASSRSSTVSQASRSAYPGVPEDVLEWVSQAKTARLAARTRYKAALATRGLSQSVILELEDRLLKTEDELKLARIERTHAKFSSPHVHSPSRSPLPSPLPMPSPSRHPPQSLLRPVPEKQAPLLQGEDLRCRGGRTGVYEDEPRKTADKLNLARTECDSAQLLDQRAATLPRRSLHPPIPVSPLLQIATQFSTQLRNMPFLEQREDPSNRCHRNDAKTGLEDQRSQIADERNLTRTERDHAKPLDRHATAAPRGSVLPTLLTSFPQPLGFEDLTPSLLEQGGKLKEPTLDLDRGVRFKTGEEVEVAGRREERTRSVNDGRAQLSGHYEHEGRSRTFVPLDREQYMTAATATRPVPHHTVPPIPAMQQPDEPKPDEQCKNRQLVKARWMKKGYHTWYLRMWPPSALGTTLTQGGAISSSWRRPREFRMPVRHIVGGFGGGGDSEGSSHWSSESDHGGGNGGGGRPPGWGDDDPGDPDHNSEGRSDDRQPRRGRHGKDRYNEPRRGPCGGGPPGGDPPDDGEPEGGKYGNSERSNRKGSKKRRGVTPFSEIPEEGSSHYDYEYFEYKVKSPTSLKKPLKERVFTRFATLIEWRLFTKMQVMGDSKAQRNLINSIPKIKQYNGQNSIIVLDNFLRGLIRHMVVQGLTGPEKIEDSEGTLVVTNEDSGRTILMAGNLTEAALEWYQTYAEHPPDSFERGMKIFRALFDRFITGAALKEIDTLYDKVKYTTLGGVRQLFSDMKMYTQTMPVPPDEFRFKDNLLEKLPQSMRRILLNDGLGPNTATIDEIMQRALAVESGWEAEAYYDATGSQLNVSESETDGGESESEETQEGGESGGYTDRHYIGDDQPLLLAHCTNEHYLGPPRNLCTEKSYLCSKQIKPTAPMKYYLGATQSNL